jgi:hypothetical protein
MQEKLQKFGWDKKGGIYLIENPSLCITAAQGEARKGGGGSPRHLIRNISIEKCSDLLKAFQLWGFRKING